MTQHTYCLAWGDEPITWFLDIHFYVVFFSNTGNPSDPMVITNKLMEVYPKLQEGGGFELLKITGPTRSRSLALLPCPSTGYTLAFLKDPSTMIGQATLYIRPLQQDLPLDCVSLFTETFKLSGVFYLLKLLIKSRLLFRRGHVIPLVLPYLASLVRRRLFFLR